jgi:hypothetical protein
MHGDPRHGDSSADLGTAVADSDPVEAEPIGEHESADADIARRVIANNERSASKEAGPGIGERFHGLPDGFRPHDLQRHRPSLIVCLVG